VILPLALPGVLAGATFAFVLSLGDFLAPLLLGGPSGIMISNIVVSLFGAAYDWPLGAAISLCMLVLRGPAADDHRAPGKALELPMKRAPWLRLHAVLVFAFLYLPIAVLSIYSFNGESVGGFPPHGWTLRWYAHAAGRRRAAGLGRQ
jgi:ABC-type spermidine/putrescine transport system permease subunit II